MLNFVSCKANVITQHRCVWASITLNIQLEEQPNCQTKPVLKYSPEIQNATLKLMIYLCGPDDCLKCQMYLYVNKAWVALEFYGS